MARKRKNKKENESFDCNYCLKQWRNFTTLTQQESENLRKILSQCKSADINFLQVKGKKECGH